MTDWAIDNNVGWNYWKRSICQKNVSVAVSGGFRWMWQLWRLTVDSCQRENELVHWFFSSSWFSLLLHTIDSLLCVFFSFLFSVHVWHLVYFCIFIASIEVPFSWFSTYILCALFFWKCTLLKSGNFALLSVVVVLAVVWWWWWWYFIIILSSFCVCHIVLFSHNFVSVALIWIGIVCEKMCCLCYNNYECRAYVFSRAWCFIVKAYCGAEFFLLFSSLCLTSFSFSSLCVYKIVKLWAQ